MYKEKEALFNKYYHLTRQLVNESQGASADFIQTLLDERQACIEEVNQLDHDVGHIIMNSVLKELLFRITQLEAKLQEKLMEEQQRVLSNITSVKKEKNIKQHYGESSFVPSGLFYDKRK